MPNANCTENPQLHSLDAMSEHDGKLEAEECGDDSAGSLNFGSLDFSDSLSRAFDSLLSAVISSHGELGGETDPMRGMYPYVDNIDNIDSDDLMDLLMDEGNNVALDTLSDVYYDDTPLDENFECLDMEQDHPAGSSAVDPADLTEEQPGTHDMTRKIEVLHRPENRIYRRRELYTRDKQHLRPLYLETRTSRRHRPYHLLPIRPVPIAFVRPTVRSPPSPSPPLSLPPLPIAGDADLYQYDTSVDHEYNSYVLPQPAHAPLSPLSPRSPLQRHPWMEVSASSSSVAATYENYESANMDANAAAAAAAAAATGSSGQYHHHHRMTRHSF